MTRARRTDGVCPICNTAEKAAGYSYCAPCRRSYQRDLRHGKHRGEPDSSIIERRLNVLRLMCDGLSHKRIARRLNLSPSTIKQYSIWLRGWSGTKNVAQLAVWAERKGLLEQEVSASCDSKASRLPAIVGAIQ